MLARQLRALSQADLARISGVSQPQVSKIENSLSQPSEEAWEKLAGAVRVPKDFLAQSDRIYGLPLSIHPPFFRKKQNINQAELGKITAEVNIRILHLRRLLKAVEIYREPNVPHLDPEEHGGSEGVAGLVRRTWLMPRGPVRDLVGLMEDAGILIGMCDFGDSHVDGISLSVVGLPPLVFLNRNQPGDRMRFSLAHELGHLVMHRKPTSTMEDEANEFAAEFLMPAADIKHQFGLVTLARLAEMKAAWRVSMQSLLMTAVRVGVEDKDSARGLWMELSSAGYRVREPIDTEFPREVPTLLSSIINDHFNKLGYSIDSLAKILNVFPDELIRMYDLDMQPRSPTLRIIK